MAINGIETLVYAVNDLDESTRYFSDFGLPLIESTENYSHYTLEEGSNVILRVHGDPKIPESDIVDSGVHETIWGVDSEENLEQLVKKLSSVCDVIRDSDGTAHFLDTSNLAVGLRIFNKKHIQSSPDPVNAPGVVNRLNRTRKWRARARPKQIQHVVFQLPDFEKAFAFYRDYLNFKLTDRQRTFGIYSRCDGTIDHHNCFFMNGNLPFPKFDGKLRFNHTNYVVEDIDELMIGVNNMKRKGWPESTWGLGRHRISSALFCYLESPAGGQAEYGADSDNANDDWIPRDYDELFGFYHFMANLPPFDPPHGVVWDFAYVDGYTPQRKDENIES